MRYFIEIAYKGTHFHGWQKQPNAKSIQETLEIALSVLFRQTIDLVGAGRTDAGVHARQLFAHFDMATSIDIADSIYRINALVPKTIIVKEIYPVIPEAHARFDALSRSYEYHIALKKDPFSLDTTWQLIHKNFDLALMNQAAKMLKNYENFKSFSKSKTDVKTYNCTITRAYWEKKGDLLLFKITANRFLRNMVRAIVGTLLDVGKGKISLEAFEQIILSQNRSNAGASVPAKGLFLTQIVYPDKIFIK